MKRYITIILAAVLAIPHLKAEDDKKVDVLFYGYLRNDMYIDSYHGIGGAEESYYLTPNYTYNQDKNGNDINEQWNSNMIAVITRFGFKFTGPDVFNAKSTARIETDFIGLPGTQPTLLRIRLAYMNLQWEKSNLRIGQDWHPFFTVAFPKVVGINTGAPFNPFTRTPLAKYDYNVGKLKFSGIAAFELQYPTVGPMGKNIDYQRDAVIPELIAGAEYSNNGFRLGGLAALKTVRPRITTDSVIITNKTVSGLNYTAYMQYKKDMLEVNLKSIYGGLMSHMIMPGGFGVSGYNAETGQEEYTTYNYLTYYLNATYGAKWKAGAFLAYAENMGTSDPLYNFGTTDKIKTRQWGRYLNNTTMYRASASLSYNVKHFAILGEYEMTTANFGEGTMDVNDGLYSQEHTATNHRINIGIKYIF